MRIFAALCIFLLANTSAFTQTQTPSPAQPSAQCTPAQKNSDGSPKVRAPLGDKLADSKGVICPPPAKDSGMNVPPPDSGAKMPVIKPPANAK
jgi:hypothetical protein